jgi:hypothetical protein
VVLVVVLVELDAVVGSDCFTDAERAALAATVVGAALAADTALLDAAAVEEGPADELAVWADVLVADPEARTVWPATSVSPSVASSDPPANQNVTARALRIPRLRRAPGGRSEDAMTDR